MRPVAVAVLQDSLDDEPLRREGATHILTGSVFAPEGVPSYTVLALLSAFWGFHHIFAGLTE